MSFTYSLSTDIGKVRNLVGDTTQASAQLSDEEISAFLSQSQSNIFASAALACRALATRHALKATSKSAGNYSENKSGIYKAYLDMAKNFEELALSDPADAQVEIITTDFNYNQILVNKTLRGESLDGQ